eukprot:2800429-Amphidinium_carterae.1
MLHYRRCSHECWSTSLLWIRRGACAQEALSRSLSSRNLCLPNKVSNPECFIAHWCPENFAPIRVMQCARRTATVEPEGLPRS